MAKNSIVVNNLHKSYKTLKVLEGVSFSVEKGKILALLGPNGAGKTTTVRILSTLLNADSGNATIEGYDVVKQADKVRTVIGLTGQAAAVDELLTGRENLIMMGRLYRLTKDSAKLRAAELLKEFDLVKAADRTAKTYSGGMRRRLDLAVSLIAVPPVIFLDEPTTGLDPRSRQSMWSIIEDLAKSGTTILLTTQYLEEADQLADQVVVIDGGKVIAEGTPQELKSKIGKDKLEITFATIKLFEDGKKVLNDKLLDTNPVERSITVLINDSNVDVKRTLEQLSKAKVPINSISVHKPTLDDVFMNITGKQKDNLDEKEA